MYLTLKNCRDRCQAPVVTNTKLATTTEVKEPNERRTDKEIEKEINHFIARYNGDFYTVFSDILSGQKDKYDLEEPDDLMFGKAYWKT